MDLVLSQDFFPRIGGAHLWLYETYRRWPTPVTLLTRTYDDSPDDVAAALAFDARNHGSLRIVRRDIAIDDIDLAHLGCWKRYRQVVAYLRELTDLSPTTVHCLRSFPEGLAGLLFRLSTRRARLVVFAHGEEVLVARSSLQLRFIAGLVYRFADVVIANSRSTQALVRTLCPAARTVCVHPGVDSAAYSIKPEALANHRKQWGWPAGTVIVSTVARMETRKNQAAVIDAIARLRRDGLSIAYVCAGDGEQRDYLADRVRKHGLQSWVRFPGILTDEQKVLTVAASDIFAMPSIQVGEMTEGFGIVFLEAAAAGVPSICGDVGGQAEAVHHGTTGLVVDGRNAGAVAAALAHLATDAGLRATMGQAGRVWAAGRDWTVVSTAVAAAVGKVGAESP